jgi:hypothetical protein
MVSTAWLAERLGHPDIKVLDVPLGRRAGGRQGHELEHILISSGAGSGKTTLANAPLAEPAFADARVFLLEDTPGAAVLVLGPRRGPDAALSEDDRGGGPRPRSC